MMEYSIVLLYQNLMSALLMNIQAVSIRFTYFVTIKITMKNLVHASL